MTGREHWSKITTSWPVQNPGTILLRRRGPDTAR